MFTTEFETITVSSQSSRRSSVTSLSDQDYQDADEFALRECIEIIEANVEEVIIDKADEREKKWWIDGNYKIIGENTRLPLILVEDVIELPNRDHEVAHGEFTRQFLNALSNVPRQNQVSNTGSTTCSSTPGCRSRGFSKQSDASYTPKQLPKPAANSCDAQKKPSKRTWRLPTSSNRNQPYNGCSSPGMCTLNISPRCMYRGCPRQNPPLPPYPITNNDVIDLHDIQQEIFDNM
ncbi:unnamed protein product [Rhizophagus irregularis]|nr:unnamed protein product [Rhizophagus irregularis]